MNRVGVASLLAALILMMAAFRSERMSPSLVQRAPGRRIGLVRRLQAQEQRDDATIAGDAMKGLRPVPRASGRLTPPHSDTAAPAHHV